MGEYRTEVPKQKKKPTEFIVPFRTRPKKDFKDPFRPAALKKCEPFINDKITYAEPKVRLEKFSEESKYIRQHGRNKYKKFHMPTFTQHDKAFKPASSPRSGLEGYIGDKKQLFGGYPFVDFEKKVLKNLREQKKAFKDPFKY